MKTDPSPSHTFINLAVNIVLPVWVLNKGGQFLDARTTLLVALCFPLIYGIQDYWRHRHKNYVSILGLANILLTGGLAMLNITGFWFAVKEAVLPTSLGLLVLGSAWTESPAAALLFCNPQVLNMTAIEERLTALDKWPFFKALLRQTTILLSLSFFASAGGNFALGYHIFQEMDPSLSEAAQTQLLNEQIARMTWVCRDCSTTYGVLRVFDLPVLKTGFKNHTTLCRRSAELTQVARVFV